MLLGVEIEDFVVRGVETHRGSDTLLLRRYSLDNIVSVSNGVYLLCSKLYNEEMNKQDERSAMFREIIYPIK